MMAGSAIIFFCGAAVFNYEKSFGRILEGGVGVLATVFLMLIGGVLLALHVAGVIVSLSHDQYFSLTLARKFKLGT